MSRLWIKVCGLTTREGVEAAVAAGADAVGFVFHADSPRHLEPEAARALSAAVPAGIERVAVFLHPEQALLDAALDATGAGWAQADADDLARLHLPRGVRALPVFRRLPGAALDTGQHLVMPRRFLFEGARSGAGEVADWSAAAALAASGELVLAGGLDASNVADAVRAVRPFGVDVSSGVERRRGVKDAALIEAFVRAARTARRGPAATDPE